MDAFTKINRKVPNMWREKGRGEDFFYNFALRVFALQNAVNVGRRTKPNIGPTERAGA